MAGLLIGLLVVVWLGFFVVDEVTGGDDETDALEGASIRLEPADAQSPHPFVQREPGVEVVPVNLVEPPELAGRVTTGLSGKVAHGGAAGLYGSGQGDVVCEARALVDLLTDPAHAAQAAAWAGAQGIAVGDIPRYVGGLTAVRLRFDTRVTNHGFAEGEARPFQSVLQAGTSVLVDRRGVPRVRCFSGTPLTGPSTADGDVDEQRALDVEALAANPGDAWEGFDPDRVVTVEPADELDLFMVADLATGARSVQWPGIRYTIQELQAALPSDGELLSGDADVDRISCGIDAPCPGTGGDMATGTVREAGLTGMAQIYASTDVGDEYWGPGGGSSLHIVARTWADRHRQEEHVDEARADLEGRSGQYDHPPILDDDGDLSIPGERGEGRLDTFEMEGWEGVIHVSTYVWVDQFGTTTSTTSRAMVDVQWGNATVNIHVVQPGEDQQAVEQSARDHLSQILESLG